MKVRFQADADLNHIIVSASKMFTTATVNDIRLAYSDAGSGFPLLCLHGGMGIDGASLRVPGILDLSNHGIRVIIPDQRGHGRSERADESTYTHAKWASDAFELARHLKLEKPALMGHSYGGFIALEYAVRWPESLSHLILITTSADPVSAPIARVGTDAQLQEHFRAVWPMFFAGADKHWPLFESLSFSKDAYNAAFNRELPLYDLRERVEELTIPTLLIAGSKDPYRPQMKSMAERMKNAILFVMENAGHFPFIEAPEEFAEKIIAFLSNNVNGDTGTSFAL